MSPTAWTDDRLDDFARSVQREFDLVHGEIAGLRGEMNEGFAALRSEMTGGLGELRSEMTEGFAALRSEMTGGLGELRSEMTEGFAALRSEMTGGLGELRAEIAAVNARVSNILLGLCVALIGVVGAMAAAAVVV